MANAPLDRNEGTLLALFNLTGTDGKVYEYAAVYVRPNNILASEPEGETVTVVVKVVRAPNNYEQHWHFYGADARTHGINKCLGVMGFPTIDESNI